MNLPFASRTDQAYPLRGSKRAMAPILSTKLKRPSDYKRSNVRVRLAQGRFQHSVKSCLLYTSDAADEEDSVDLGGRRIIKKKKKRNIKSRANIERRETAEDS
eukprot:TRINITY_DN1884_c0_g1_i2.p1 TRINITY_DN1884_c0_g1~~TRINITY_DN1884_c0_g1_i2.p1  ORF type:complete len:103 (-),score=9.00 TRINITY_DN1884_c0_g1_i2:5-313(-)